jgi:hypothetical protein
MEVCVLRDMSPELVRENLKQFSESYVLDWEQWLQVDDSNRVAKFASILRSWQGTRPLPMRRLKAEASHEPPPTSRICSSKQPRTLKLSVT